MEPQQRLGVARLARMAFEGMDLTSIRAELIKQGLEGPDQQAALMDLSVVDQIEGDSDQGQFWQDVALDTAQLYATRPDTPVRKRLLVFAKPSRMGGNTPVEFLLSRSEFEILTCYPNFERGLPKDLPIHDVAFCAAPADDDGSNDFFEGVRAMTRDSDRPVLNLPAQLTRLDRDHLAQAVKNRPGLRYPKTQRISRSAIEFALNADQIGLRLSAVGRYPFVVRPVGSHAGIGLQKIESADAFSAYLNTRSEDAFFVSEFINYATAQDELFRKYRVVFVAGRPFPVHMAVSNRWDLWYMNAGMSESQAKRDEEALWMENFEDAFLSKHAGSFQSLVDAIGLDYFGIDCAEDGFGNLVLFEADNALIVHDMDPEDQFGYKKPHMHNIFNAFEALLLDKCSAESTRVRKHKPTGQSTAA